MTEIRRQNPWALRDYALSGRGMLSYRWQPVSSRNKKTWIPSPYRCTGQVLFQWNDDWKVRFMEDDAKWTARGQRLEVSLEKLVCQDAPPVVLTQEV